MSSRSGKLSTRGIADVTHRPTLRRHLDTSNRGRRRSGRGHVAGVGTAHYRPNMWRPDSHQYPDQHAVTYPYTNFHRYSLAYKLCYSHNPTNRHPYPHGHVTCWYGYTNCYTYR